MKDPHFKDSTNNGEVDAWSSFTMVVQNFLGNYEAENYIVLVERMLSYIRRLNCTMNIQEHYSHNHLDRLTEKLGGLNEDQGEDSTQNDELWKKNTGAAGKLT